jgi:hypothetical protein
MLKEIEIAANNKEHVDLVWHNCYRRPSRNLTAKKTHATEGLNTEMFKCTSQRLPMRFLDLINICWMYGHVPKEWKMAFIAKNRQNCEYYSGKCTLTSRYKTYMHIDNNTNSKQCVWICVIWGSQWVWGEGRHVRIVSSLFINWLRNNGNNLPALIVFLDYDKAFDKVIRNELWPAMIDKGIPQYLIKRGTTLIFRYEHFDR